MLEKVQQGFLRQIKGMKETLREDRLNVLGLQPISVRHLRAISIQANEKVSGMSATDDIIQYISHTASTRAASRTDLVTPKVRKEHYKYSFSAVAPNVYNEVHRTKGASTLSSFKRGFDDDVKNGELLCATMFS